MDRIGPEQSSSFDQFELMASFSVRDFSIFVCLRRAKKHKTQDLNVLPYFLRLKTHQNGATRVKKEGFSDASTHFLTHEFFPSKRPKTYGQPVYC